MFTLEIRQSCRLCAFLLCHTLNIHKYAFKDNLESKKRYSKLLISMCDSIQYVTNAYEIAKIIIPSF